MAIKEFNARIVHKHDTEANWLLTNDFVPLLGEIILYDPDNTHSDWRMKIGDGVTNINSLNFVDIDAKELPSVTSSDNGKLLGVSSGSWTKVDAPTELPSVTSYDNGKVLGVIEGSWGKVRGLPIVSNSDNGKNLSVVLGQWAAKDETPFFVTYTHTNTYDPSTGFEVLAFDHTLAEINSANAAGREIIGQISLGNNIWGKSSLSAAFLPHVAVFSMSGFKDSEPYKPFIFEVIHKILEDDSETAFLISKTLAESLPDIDSSDVTKFLVVNEDGQWGKTNITLVTDGVSYYLHTSYGDINSSEVLKGGCVFIPSYDADIKGLFDAITSQAVAAGGTEIAIDFIMPQMALNIIAYNRMFISNGCYISFGFLLDDNSAPYLDYGNNVIMLTLKNAYFGNAEDSTSNLDDKITLVGQMLSVSDTYVNIEMNIKGDGHIYIKAKADNTSYTPFPVGSTYDIAEIISDIRTTINGIEYSDLYNYLHDYDGSFSLNSASLSNIEYDIDIWGYSDIDATLKITDNDSSNIYYWVYISIDTSTETYAIDNMKYTM